MVDLAALYAPLRKRFADLNIEGALVVSGELLLLQRGNKGDRRNARIRVRLDRVFAATLAHDGARLHVEGLVAVAVLLSAAGRGGGVRRGRAVIEEDDEQSPSHPASVGASDACVNPRMMYFMAERMIGVSGHTWSTL